MNEKQGQPFAGMKLPEGCRHLHGAMFLVPFAAIKVPQEAPDAEAEYRFRNPRLLTEQGQAALIDKGLSSNLRESIKTRTLLNPLTCRWVENEGIHIPQVLGGDRRYRALDFLIRKKEIVKDPNNVTLNDQGEWVYGEAPADQAYEYVLCQVFFAKTDLDAAALAWAENKDRVNLSEGHEVAAVIELRRYNATDERILDILRQDEKWLRETDNIIANLDPDTLKDLLEGRIDRAAAKELMNIEDVALRGQVRQAANQDSQEANDIKIKRLQKKVMAALDQQEIAQGDVADAKYQKDGEALEQATTNLAEADAKVKRTVQERDETKPVTNRKQVKDAKDKITGDGTPPEEKPRLKLANIRAAFEYLDALIKNNGKCLEGSFLAPPKLAKTIKRFIRKHCIEGDKDYAATIRVYCKKDAQVDD